MGVGSRRLLKTLDVGVHYACIAAVLAFALLPLLWMVSGAFKPSQEVYALPASILPKKPTLANFASVLTDRMMLRYLFNSTVIASLTTLFTLFVAITSGYGFARFKFRGKTLVFASILFARLIPSVVFIIPFFVIFRTLGLIDTYHGVALAYCVQTIPLSIWMLTSYFETVPYELEEAAKIDGCSNIGIVFRIVLPVAAPAIAAVSIYAFVLAWNEFLLGLVLTRGSGVRPVSVGLAQFSTEAGIVWEALVTASLIMSVVPVAVFLFSGQYLVKGLASGAAKG